MHSIKWLCCLCRDFKFGTQVSCSQSQDTDYKPSLKGGSHLFPPSLSFLALPSSFPPNPMNQSRQPVVYCQLLHEVHVQLGKHISNLVIKSWTALTVKWLLKHIFCQYINYNMEVHWHNQLKGIFSQTVTLCCYLSKHFKVCDSCYFKFFLHHFHAANYFHLGRVLCPHHTKSCHIMMN